MTDGVMLVGLLAPALRVILIVALAAAAIRLGRSAAPRFATLAVRIEGATGSGDIEKRRETLARVTRRVLSSLVLIVAVFTLLSAVGIDIGPALAGLGVAGIAVGFGAQAIVRDMLGGVLIVIENQFGKGDVVRVAGVAGMVEEITLRRTVLRDLDGVVHSVPNGEIGVASNLTRGWSRVNIDIAVAYREDLGRVRRVIDDVGRELAEDAAWSARVIEAPAVLRVEELAESGVTLKVLATTLPLEQWNVAGELRQRIKEAFDREGIEIPYPHRVVVTRGG